MKTLLCLTLVALPLFAACAGTAEDEATSSTGSDFVTDSWTLTASCNSPLFRHNDCGVDTRGGTIVGVRVTGDQSIIPVLCAQDNAYGFTGSSVWVDKGCSATFEVTVAGGFASHPGGPGGGGDHQQVECSSNQNQYAVCDTSIDNIREIRVVRQESSSPCQENRSYGVTGGSIWVNYGCRALFDVSGVGHGGGGHGGGGHGGGGHGNGGHGGGGAGSDDSVVLYDQQGFNGLRFSVNSDIDNMDTMGFNDRAQSMVVNDGNWEACQNAGYNGICQTFGPGSYSNLGVLSLSLSSLRRR